MDRNALNRLWKRISFRLTLWYSGLFIVSVLALFGLAYFLMASSIQQRERDLIQAKLQEFTVQYQSGGIQALKRELIAENRTGKQNQFFVRVASPHNRTVFIHIPDQWAEYDLMTLERNDDLANKAWVRLPAHDDENVLELGSLRLSDGFLLQVGKSTEDLEELLEDFRQTFIGIMLPLILVGFSGGMFLAFRTLRPIRMLIQTVRSIAAGRMDRRVPIRQTGDELDELAILINGMLDTIAALINGMRNSLDTVAHDLRTPMTRLRGIAEIALRTNQKDQDYRDALADCLEESDRILTMLHTLMDISEAETGAMKLTLEGVHLFSAIAQMVDLYQYVAEEKKITIITHVPKDLYVTADGTRIRQVLANLLDNAIKYTPCGGQITLEAFQQQQYMVIRVRDTGIGIPPPELPYIWDRLYRGDQSRSQRGMGLGLSLVKAIIHAHRGKIEVASEPGMGSQFVLYLPINPTQSP